MEKNENGTPLSTKNGNGAPGRTPPDMGRSNPSPDATHQKNGAMNHDTPMPQNERGANDRSMRMGDCGEIEDCLDSRPLAYVYAPNQRFCMLYSAEDALNHGTLFEALYKPKEVYGRE